LGISNLKEAVLIRELVLVERIDPRDQPTITKVLLVIGRGISEHTRGCPRGDPTQIVFDFPAYLMEEQVKEPLLAPAR
jgi:hypothetical protein